MIYTYKYCAHPAETSGTQLAWGAAHSTNIAKCVILWCRLSTMPQLSYGTFLSVSTRDHSLLALTLPGAPVGPR